jgi:hypothetical protein
MSERTLVNYLMRGMKGKWKVPVKHADQFTEGVADVSGHLPRCGTLWVECKAKGAFPKRPGTNVKVGLSPMQRRFLVGRRGWLLVRVGREYFLFHHLEAAKWIDKEGCTQERFRSVADRCWSRSIRWDDFINVIRHYW